MKAILLSAGYGTRLRPITDVLPKCLLPINGHPLLEYWINLLFKAQVFPVLINLHYLSNIVKEWLSLTGYTDKIETAYEGSLLGTAGTLLKNRDFAGNGPVMLIHADNLSYFEPVDFINAHLNRPKDAAMTMMTFKTTTPETCGIVKTDANGIVEEFYEKVINPPGDCANAAVYIVEPEIIDFLISLSKETIDFSTEVLPVFVNKRKVFTYHNGYYHRDIGTLENYLEAQVDFPYGVIENQKKDAWKSLCTKSESQFDKKLLSILSKALNAEIIDIMEFIRFGRNILEKKGKIIVYCDEADRYIENITNIAEDRYLKKFIVLVFFKRASSFFSSKALYEKTGFKSIILYRDNDLDK